MKKSKKKNHTQIIQSFDPNEAAFEGSNIFGLPFTIEEASIVLIPVPWEVTVSYASGTARGPACILEASKQVDLFHLFNENVWKQGIAMDEIPREIEEINDYQRSLAKNYLSNYVKKKLKKNSRAALEEINNACHYLNEHVKNKSEKFLNDGKIVGVVGGDHSSPLGLLQALAQRNQNFSILQIDAHADLRNAYEGFLYSHASIMYNAVQLRAVSNLVQVGVRDLCEEEYRFIEKSANRISCFHNEYLSSEKFSGRSWKSLADVIVSHLSENVYISFDIDGLEAQYCPNTGTPVPGGLSYNEAVFLIRRVVESGRKIIGFDLCEVAPRDNDWDANVGARLLFELCAWSTIHKN